MGGVVDPGGMAADPIVIADVVLDAALSADAESIQIEPFEDRYVVKLRRQGETLGTALLAPAHVGPVVARLGFVCNADPTNKNGATGRSRVKANSIARDLIMTIRPGLPVRAELIVLPAAATTQGDIAIGDRIGHYRVTGAIGAGGMGSVYEVVHEKLGRRHALKVLQNWVRDRDRESIDRFLSEAQSAARIRSPHIVDVFDFGFLADGRPYFVMELLAGAPLGLVLERQGAMNVASAVLFARQLARALTAAHERDVIHADVSPANIFISGEHLTLIDFGLAQLRQASDAQADRVSGTPAYLAPERITGCAANEASDQYAFGAVLYELLAGHPPYLGVDAEEICLAHLQAPVPEVTNPYTTVPAPLVSIIERCLAKSPEARFSSMSDVLAELVAIPEVSP